VLTRFDARTQHAAQGAIAVHDMMFQCAGNMKHDGKQDQLPDDSVRAPAHIRKQHIPFGKQFWDERQSKNFN
jgi:hypothetical protein